MAMSRSAGSSLLTTRSPIFSVPEVIVSRPATMRRSVDLPQPEGPTRTTSSPSAMSREMPLTAGSVRAGIGLLEACPS
jgi:hypothetical protein